MNMKKVKQQIITPYDVARFFFHIVFDLRKDFHPDDTFHDCEVSSTRTKRLREKTRWSTLILLSEKYFAEIDFFAKYDYSPNSINYVLRNKLHGDFHIRMESSHERSKKMLVQKTCGQNKKGNTYALQRSDA